MGNEKKESQAVFSEPTVADQSANRSKNFGKSIKKLITYFRPYWFLIILSILFAGAGSLLTVLGTDKMSDMTDIIKDGILSGMDMDQVIKTGVILAVMYILSAVMTSVQGVIMTFVTQKTSKKFRNEISNKLKKLPLRYFHNMHTGDILSRVTNDVDNICESLNMSINGLVSSLTLFVGSLVMMFATDWILTLSALGSTFIGFLLVGMMMGRSQQYFLQQQKNLGAVNSYIEEMYSGHMIVKAFSGEAKAKKEFDQLNNKLCESNFKAECVSGLMMPIMTFVGHLGYVTVCIVGGLLTMKGRISFGVIVSFMLYVNYFIQPMAQIGQGAQSLQSAAASGERVFELLDAEEMPLEENMPAKLDNIIGDVSFKQVKFGYEGANKLVINNFTADVYHGQKIAIVGATGAGKTTLVNLLMRFYEINDGLITIDGVSIRDLSRENVRQQFGMVLQDTWIFEGTIRDNLVLSLENITHERLDEVCKAVGLYHFVMTLPDGYDTILNEKVTLSSGQKQQLAIARAMIADRKMLILDEATSSVDTRLELKIQNSMDSLMKGRTSFVIAHRLSTIVNADLILVMQNGDIAESGTHKELLAKNGVYAEIYNSQFEPIS